MNSSPPPSALAASSAEDRTRTRAIVPVSMQGYDADFQAFADALGASFSRYGFAVIADHGLDQPTIDAAIADAKAFFALPEDVKRQYHQPGTGGARGLTPFGVEAQVVVGDGQVGDKLAIGANPGLVLKPRPWRVLGRAHFPLSKVIHFGALRTKWANSNHSHQTDRPWPT